MTTTQPIGITSPVGRLVQGSVYQPQTKDMEGNPLVVKNGPNKGQPTERYYFAIAIPKNPNGQHWAHEEWGKIIWQTGHAAFPGGQAQRPDFAWKIEDGDSTIPNKKMRKPCDQVGFAGHWVLRLSSTFAPKCYNRDGTAAMEPSSIKTGYFVQVFFTVAGNDDANRNPGVYLNPSMVAFQAYGEEISFGPDPSQAGFGGAALPPGASATPPAGLSAPPTSAAPVAPVAPVAPAPVAPVPVAPHTTILATTPATAAPPPPPAAPVAPVGRQMTAKANGVTYEAFIAGGWSDATLIAHGMMTA